MKSFPHLKIAALCCVLLVSCSQADFTEKAARKDIQKLLIDPLVQNGARIDGLTTVYKDEGLVICKFKKILKNKIGWDLTYDMECVSIVAPDFWGEKRFFHAWHEVGSDEPYIYLSEEDYNHVKKGKIYESLSYKDGLRYRATLLHNRALVGMGYQKNMLLPVKTDTGGWEIVQSKDEFGSYTGEKKLRLIGIGTYSNSFDTDEPLKVYLYDNGHSSFSLHLGFNIYNSFDCRIKDSKGKVHQFSLMRDSNLKGVLRGGSRANKLIKELLMNGGIVTVSLKENDSYGVPTTCQFIIDLDGYQKALEYLPGVTVQSQSNWTSTTVEGKKAYTITSTDSKGNQCNIVLFYEDYGFTEAWFTMPKKTVVHEDLPRFSVYWHFTYTENNKQETVELGGRDWSCTGNEKINKKLEAIINSTIVADAAIGAAPFFHFITKSQKPVVLKLPTSTGDLVFTVPVLKGSGF